MSKLHDLLIEKVIAEAVANGDTEPNQDDLVERLTELVPTFVESSAATLLNQIKKDSTGGLRRQRRKRLGFERRLAKHWAQPLHLLELTVEIAQEVAKGVGDQVASGEVSVDEHTFRALWAIHARACQTSRAILTLLRSGFADDAHARWRSLHELAVVGNFIEIHGEVVAERYLLHEVVQQRKLARAYKEHETRARLEPLTQAEIDVLDERCETLVDRFGKEFNEDYGWAASALGIKRPSIAEIERAAQLDHHRPYYRMASDNVHANSHGAFFKLGGFSPDIDILLAGPSNMGLADPGHEAALSLTQITAALVSTAPTLDSLTELTVLNLLQEETGAAFLQAHKDAEAIAESAPRRNAGPRRRVNRHSSRLKMASGLGDQTAGLLLKCTSTKTFDPHHDGQSEQIFGEEKPVCWSPSIA